MHSAQQLAKPDARAILEHLRALEARMDALQYRALEVLAEFETAMAACQAETGDDSCSPPAAVAAETSLVG